MRQAKTAVAHRFALYQLDIAGARQAFVNAGLSLKDGILTEEDRKRVAGVLVNAGADYVTNVRGRRHVLHSDFLAPFCGIQAKAVSEDGEIVPDDLVLEGPSGGGDDHTLSAEDGREQVGQGLTGSCPRLTHEDPLLLEGALDRCRHLELARPRLVAR